MQQHSLSMSWLNNALAAAVYPCTGSSVVDFCTGFAVVNLNIRPPPVTLEMRCPPMLSGSKMPSLTILPGWKRRMGTAHSPRTTMHSCTATMSQDSKKPKKATGGIMRRRVTTWLARVRLLDKASLGFEQPQQQQQWQQQPSSQTSPKVNGVTRGTMRM